MPESESHSDASSKALRRCRPSQDCQVHLGAVFNDSRYQVLRKLGQGRHSTVWLAKDRETNRYVALKIAKSKLDSSSQELEIWRHLSSGSQEHPGKKHVMILLDSFEHRGPTGVHECFVFEVMGSSARSYIKECNSPTTQPNVDSSRSQSNTRIRLPFIKSLLQQVLLGLDSLHTRGILHNDLHSGNILMSIQGLHSTEEYKLDQQDGRKVHTLKVPAAIQEKLARVHKSKQPFKASGSVKGSIKGPRTSRAARNKIAMVDKRSPTATRSSKKLGKPDLAASKDPQPVPLALPPPFNGAVNLISPVRIKITDMGSAFFLARPPHHPKTPDNIRSPEMILGCSVSQSQDIWTVGCLIFELISGRALFMVNPREHRTDHDDGDDAIKKEDDFIIGEVLHDSARICKDSEENKLAARIRRPSFDIGYLQQFACRLGPLPPLILSKIPKASQFFGKNGASNPGSFGSPPWTSMEAHFDSQPPLVDVSPAERLALFDFIYCIMQYDPEKRPSARQILRHVWFRGVGGCEG